MPMPAKTKAPKVSLSGRPLTAAEKKKAIIDELIQGTNSESITSKRSVEKLYYPPPHYFTHFVPKDIRRSPLVNRGYWFRLHAIDSSIRTFLEAPLPPKCTRKVVVNLGCGSDVLPWQCALKYRELLRWQDHQAPVTEQAIFIDIDYPDMIQKKAAIVTRITELAELLGVDFTHTPDLPLGTGAVLTSPRYTQLACDLRDLSRVQSLMASLTPLETSQFLFIAEVSITYISTSAADAVIAWSSSLLYSSFTLLEQLLPDSENHPFAHNMLFHFNKLSTTLYSVHKYPTSSAQEQRFRDLGYTSVHAQNLWQAWSNSVLTSSSDRADLDQVEPFDEWEELAVFGAHYVLVSASNTTTGDAPTKERRPTFDMKEMSELEVMPINVKFSAAPSPAVHRHHGLAVSVGNSTVVSILGQGISSRCTSIDIYGTETPNWSFIPSPRVCSAMTRLPSGTLLCGGRTSPGRAMASAYLLDASGWAEVSPMPRALYRHSLVAISDAAFLFGGKTNAITINETAYLYKNKQWIILTPFGSIPSPRFGATIGKTAENRGFISGGITNDGTVSLETFIWTIDIDKETVTFALTPTPTGLLARFSALCIPVPRGTIIVGGIIGDSLVPFSCEILLVSATSSFSKGLIVKILRDDKIISQTKRPFWIGAAGVYQDANGTVDIIGGGATCYAMGTYWSPGHYAFSLEGTIMGEQTEYKESVQVKGM